MPVHYQRLTYRYWQGRVRPADTLGRAWPAGVQAATLTGARRPPVDVWETADQLVVKVILAGVEEDQINAELYEDVLLVNGRRADDSGDQERRFYRAEIHYGRLEVAVPLPVPIEADGVEATYRQGVLTVRLPKRVTRS